jgi:hypothetical protein
VKDNDTATCGQSCTPCPTIPNGGATCDGKSCALFCGIGYHLCNNNVCRLNNDVASCGNRCDPCPTVPDGEPVCDYNERCALLCRNGSLNCLTRCLRPIWTFETGTDGVHLSQRTLDADPPRHSIAHPYTGQGALAQPLRPGTHVEGLLPICGDPMYQVGVDLSFRTVSFWYYYDGPDPSQAPRIGVSASSAGSFFLPTFNVRQWTKVSRLLDGKQFNGVGEIGYEFVGHDTDPSATLYIDDIIIE